MTLSTIYHVLQAIFLLFMFNFIAGLLYPNFAFKYLKFIKEPTRVKSAVAAVAFFIAFGVWTNLSVFAPIKEQDDVEQAQRKAEKDVQQKSNEEHIEILLSKIDRGQICTMYFDIKNKTKINFTNMAFDTVTRDSSNNIVNKDMFQVKATPNCSVVASHMENNCSSVSKVEIVGFAWITQIDGDILSDDLKKRINDMPIQSASSVDGLTVTSNGGKILGQNNNNSSENKSQDKSSIASADACMRNCGDEDTSCISLSMAAEQDCKLKIQACQLKCLPN